MIAPVQNPRVIASVDDLLRGDRRDEQDLTAVERYARRHDRGDLPTHASRYSDLMPASPPRPGQQYAFEVDLDRCTGCKACVAACHNLNGLEPEEFWRSTGLLIGGTSEQPFQQTVTSACHHCLEPACLNGCPVGAYEKDAVTGIVRHLDDQCIGCRYCLLTCPYDVPKFSRSKGIVRKCDMCSSRLEAHEPPACVQACPNKAIRIHVVEVDQVVERSEARIFLPGASSPDKTMPTTTYRSSRSLPQNVLPADYHTVRKEDAHIPLVIMLVLTQLSVGAFIWDFFQGELWGRAASAAGKPVQAVGAWLIGLVALGVSTTHLGRPHYAFRALLGLRKSWLSREILTFGLYAFGAALYAATFWADFAVPGMPMPELRRAAHLLAVISGAAGVFCSVMLYAVTKRPLWSGPATGFKFFATTALLGISMTLLLSSLQMQDGRGEGLGDSFATQANILLPTLMGLASVKLFWECSIFFHLRGRLHSPLRRAAMLMRGTLRRATTLRLVCGALGGLAVPGLLMLMLQDSGAQAGRALVPSLTGLSLLALIAGELLERYLFFVTSVSLRMPGGPAR